MVFSDASRQVDPSVLDAPLHAILHRGPDGEGRLVRRGIAAGMRRLAIIDIAGGDQPIWNEDHTIAVLYNGEIYNYRELRAFCEAKGHHFKTESDTEVIVHLYEIYGDDFVSKLNGMFAICLWDEPRKRALLIRDRFGIKPLYLRRTKAGVAFASEIRAFKAMGITQVQFDPQWAGDYLRFLWIPEPRTAWEGVERMAPGTYLVIEDGLERGVRRYYRPKIGPGDGRTEEIPRLLRKSVERQLLSEVPVGVFLSGGLDSSILASLAAESGANIPAHTIRLKSGGARDAGAEDAEYAAVVAKGLGLRQYEHEIDSDFVDWLPKIVNWTDDPIGDPALIHTYLICSRAKEESTVLLSGMGADELNGGYRRHIAAHAMAPLYGLPTPLVELATGAVNRAAHAFGLLATKSQLARRIQKAGSALPADPRHLAIRYAEWTSHERIESLGLRITSFEELAASLDERVEVRGGDLLTRALAFDVGMYLPSHNLRYVDKMSMAASAEVRVPFLDHELADELLALPDRDRVRGATGKIALRSAASALVPPSVLRRPKVGFGAPLRDWMTGHLGDVVQDTVMRPNAEIRSWLDGRGLDGLIEANGEEDLSYTIWGLLTLELWARAVKSQQSAAPSVFSE